MKKLLLLMTMIFAVVASANAEKTDYKNPVKIDSIGAIKVTKPANITRNCYLWTDKYNNHCFVININYFIKKGKDIVNLILNNETNVSLKPKKTYTLDTGQILGYMAWYGSHIEYFSGDYKPQYSNASTQVTYKEFFTVYPITEEEYNNILNNGIKDISVDGFEMTFKPRD